MIVQLGLFAGHAEPLGAHRVSAHCRVLENGTEVFVPEHWRQHRGRQPARFQPPTQQSPPQEHWWKREEVELEPGALQLPLWQR